MIPVYQTMTVANNGQGNCFNACIASIIEMPLRDVGNILPQSPNYWEQWEKWFAERGLFLNMHGSKNIPNGFAIASGFSGRTYPENHKMAGKKIRHAVVVFGGELVHDPFPAATGDWEFDGLYWTIDPITEVQKAEISGRFE